MLKQDNQMLRLKLVSPAKRIIRIDFEFFLFESLCYCCVALEDLAEASTSFTKSDNKPRAKRLKARKAEEKQQQRPIYPIRCCK